MRAPTAIARLVWVAALAGGAGCVDIPSPSARDAAPALEPGGDGRPDTPPGDMRRPPPTDAARPPPDRSLPTVDQGPPPTDAAVPITDAAVDVALEPPSCPGVAKPAANLGLCVRIDRCPELPEPRIGHRLARLDSGRVLLAGGGDSLRERDGLRRDVWLFDGAAWNVVSSMSVSLHRHTLTAISGDRAFLVAGDLDVAVPVDDPQSDAYLYRAPRDPDDDDEGWDEDTDYADRRARHAAIWTGQRLIVAGGLGGAGNPVETEIWTEDDDWNQLGGDSPPLFDHHIVQREGELLMFGGRVADNGGGAPANATVYRLGDEDWQPILQGVEHRVGPAVDTPAGVLLVSGESDGPGARLRRLTADRVEALDDLQGGEGPVERVGSAAARVGSGSLVVVLGGLPGDAERVTLTLVDVADGTRDAVVMPAADARWRDMQAVTLSDGFALFVGGARAGEVTDRCLRISVAEP